MRLRTKLLLSWGLLVVLLWAGSLWPVQRTIESNFARVANENFDGTKRSLTALQAEHEQRMRQVCRLIMTIPGLRALIAEQNYEVSSTNRASLEERLDSLTETLSVNFICVLDSRGRLIAQNQQSPWQSLAAAQGYFSDSAQAKSLVRRVFSVTESPAGEAAPDTYGVWAYQGRLYQVVGLPLIFGTADDGRPQADGALVLATPISDQLAGELGTSHHCEVGFLHTDGLPVASSIAPAARGQIPGIVKRQTTSSAPFDADMNAVAYRCSLEPLLDPCSNTPVGAMLIQSSLADARAVQAKISRVLLAILLSGLLAAALGSYFLSGVITNPVALLLVGVRRIAGGDLEHSVRINRRDELGELATAFNDMLSQLRTRRELQRQVEISQAASRAKSQFLANMSHEIRTPLNGVIGMAELLMATDLNQRQRRYASLAKSSAEVLTTLINDILDFSKIEAGKLELECGGFNPTNLVEDVIDILAPKAYAKGLEISCDIADNVPPLVRGDANRVRQVLINLVSNAIKFTHAGSVAVRVLPETGTGEHLMLRFCVSDTGIGIPPDRIDRLFKSFSQADASTTRKYGGTGLGLAISKQLAELMGGTIGVESEPNRGSTFWFSIAVAADPGQHAKSTLSTTALDGMRILVAQSNPTTGELICRWLSELGAQPQGISSSDEALVILENAARDGTPFNWAIIGDAGKGLRGLEFGSAIKLRPGLENTNLLLLLRADQECDLSKLRDAGFRGYVNLPLRRSQLIEALMLDAAKTIQPALAPTGRAQLSPTSLTKSNAQGVRILLAEDNEVNQLIVTDLLANAGYPCDVVADGIKATQAALSGDYALLLMDCQMPGMDGFEATRVIREREHANTTPSSRHLPIIALTANAIAGDRERCLEAGMDAYCTKPIEARRLIEMIQELLSKHTIHQPQPQPVSLTPQSTTPKIPADNSAEARTLDMESLLRRCTGKPALAAKVLEKLTRHAADALKELEIRATEHNAAQIARIAHGLKGAAAMAAAEPLRQAAGRLEELGRSDNLSGLEASLETLRQEVQRCNQCVQKAVENLSLLNVPPTPQVRE